MERVIAHKYGFHFCYLSLHKVPFIIQTGTSFPNRKNWNNKQTLHVDMILLLLLLERVLMRNQLNRSERDFVVIDHLVANYCRDSIVISCNR